MPTCRECHYYQEMESGPAECFGVSVEPSRDARDCPKRAFQLRIEKWLVPPYDTLYKNVVTSVTELYRKDKRKDWFTLHDDTHCKSVEAMIKVIVAKAAIQLSGLEKFLVSCAAWTHDIGMINSIAQSYFDDVTKKEYRGQITDDKRREHHNISCWYILTNSGSMFGSPPDGPHEAVTDHYHGFARAVSLMIQYHRKSEDVRSCRLFTSIKDEVVRLRLLAAILRMGDTLHKDVSRFEPGIYNILQIASSDRTTRLHWLKSYLVSNIHLDQFRQTVTVRLHLPDPEEFMRVLSPMSPQESASGVDSWRTRVRNLEHIIRSDLEEDLVTVNEIFADHEMPTYVGVRIDTVPVRGFSREYYEEVDGVLNDLDIVFSPNTSNVIKTCLDSLSAYKQRFERLRVQSSFDEAAFNSEFEELKKYLVSISGERPHHVGLAKITKLLPDLATADSPEERTKRIASVVKEIRDFRKTAREGIGERHPQIIPEKIQNVVVLGYSATVVEVMHRLAQDSRQHTERMHIIVLNCSAKRRLGHSNLIEYDDGIHYANQLARGGNYQVFLIPDGGLATLMALGREGWQQGLLVSPQGGLAKDQLREIPRLTQTDTLVLFGANGVCPKTGDCGHTSGHLAVAIIANHFRFPVKILADSFKFGNMDWRPGMNRLGEWLTTQRNHLEELKRNGIIVMNLRQDRIPAELIQEIHTEQYTLRPRDDRPTFSADLSVVVTEVEEFWSRLKTIAKGAFDPNAAEAASESIRGC